VTVRRLTDGDIPMIRQLEAEAYLPELHESDEAFLQLIRLYPEGAIGCFDEHGLCGYAFGMPSVAGTIFALREPLERIQDNADTFYIHDVAVAARCRGRGVGRLLATRLIDLARERRFTRSELVSVQGSAPFWQRFGFEPVVEFEYVPGAPSTKMARRI
jgi:GNAT superfamily N-acetyltransferase